MLPPFFSLLDSVFLGDLCNPDAVDQSPEWLKDYFLAPDPSDKSFNNAESNYGPLFAQEPSMWPVWKYRGQAKPLGSGF